MQITPCNIAGIGLLGLESQGFEQALSELLGRAPRILIAPALPYSVIVLNDAARAIALLGVRFDMTGPRGKPYSVIHYSDTLRNPEKGDFLPGARRFISAEPSYTSLLLRQGDDLSSRGRNNLDNLRRMLDIRASIDCVVWENGGFEGPDTQGAFERISRQREMERVFLSQVMEMSDSTAEQYLRIAAEDSNDRARKTLGRKLLEGLETGGMEEMIRRARGHRLKIPVWRQG